MNGQVLASTNSASSSQPSSTTLGSWLKQLRLSKALAQRTIAAKIDMDSSHYGKIESDKRLPTLNQCTAIARCLGASESEICARVVAARMLRYCGGNHALARAAAKIARKQAALSL
jgi:transcriptional regulator with XRE-family HTH domain